MNAIRIMVADNHPVFRQGLCDLLELDPNFIVVDQAADSETALYLALKQQPDIILLDLNLPGETGLTVTRKLRVALPKCRTIITGYGGIERITVSLRAGASAFCAKDTLPEALFRTVYAVAQGKFVVGRHEFNKAGIDRWLSEQLVVKDDLFIADQTHYNAEALHF